VSGGPTMIQMVSSTMSENCACEVVKKDMINKAQRMSLGRVGFIGGYSWKLAKGFVLVLIVAEVTAVANVFPGSTLKALMPLPEAVLRMMRQPPDPWIL